MLAYSKHITALGLTGLVSIFMNAAWSADLDIADNALEVAPTVEPNVFLLTDDSGSMNFGIMAPQQGGEYRYKNVDYRYTHPDGGTSATGFPASNSYLPIAERATYNGSSWVFDQYRDRVLPSEESAPGNGLWRAWFSGYNKIYYDPNLTYEPWSGVDVNANEFKDADPKAAHLNPFRPSDGSLDLTSEVKYRTVTDLDWDTWKDGSYYRDTVDVDDFYPARYYTWKDSDNDGVVDDDDGFQLVEIRESCDGTAECSWPKERTGRTDCGAADKNGVVSCSYDEEIQNFANWFTYYRKRDLAAKAAMSGVLADVKNGRIGLASINNNIDPLAVQPMNLSAIEGKKRTLLDRLFSVEPTGGTPLREPLEKVGRYYECSGGQEDILGNNGSKSLVSVGDANNECPVLQESDGGTCQQNYTILFTDGFYNGSYGDYAGNADASSGTTDPVFDGGAFADTLSNTLADVAMRYYKNDLHTSLDNEVVPTSRDINRYPLESGYPTSPGGTYDFMHQHMKTFTVSLGVDGMISSMPKDPAAAFKWPESIAGDSPEKIDDLRHAAYNGRGDYKSAANTQELIDSMNEIFDQIGQDEGAASAVAFNTQNIESGSLVFRAFFNTRLNTGNLVAQPVTTEGVVEGVTAWEAAKTLDGQTAEASDNRVFITYQDTGAFSSQGVPLQWDKLTTDQQLSLYSTAPTSLTSATELADYGKNVVDWLRGQSKDEGGEYDLGGLRARPTTEGRLGDLVHSAPVFYGAPAFTQRHLSRYPQDVYDISGNVVEAKSYSSFKQKYKDRDSVVYIGGNDGLMHAFSATSGREMFAYMPNRVFEEKANEGSKAAYHSIPDYLHQFTVDATPSVMDIFYNGPNSASRDWATVLIGGLGAGGRGYYALDVTDPDKFDTEVNAAANVLWEFTADDDDDLGLTFSMPRQVMTNAVHGAAGCSPANDDNCEHKWMALFGNGYNAQSADGDAILYALDPEGGLDGNWTVGSDYFKLDTGNGKAESADGATPNGISGINVIDLDGNGTADYVYAGDLQGNLYKFDITDSDPSNWFVQDVMFEATYSYDGTDYVQPITNAPISVRHPDSGGIMVIFGTGTWMTNGDRTADGFPDDIQSIYAIWDHEPASGSFTQITKDELIEQNFINEEVGVGGYTVRTSTNEEVNLNDKAKGKTPRVMGWTIDLDMPAAGTTTGVEFPGERAVRRFLYRKPFIFFNTIIPDSQSSCAPGAGGYSLALNPLTGGSIVDGLEEDANVIFDLNDDGVFDEFDNAGDEIVTGRRFDGAMPSDSSMIGNTMATQTSDKNIDFIETNTGEGASEGRQSWRELSIY